MLIDLDRTSFLETSRSSLGRHADDFFELSRDTLGFLQEEILDTRSSNERALIRARLPELLRERDVSLLARIQNSDLATESSRHPCEEENADDKSYESARMANHHRSTGGALQIEHEKREAVEADEDSPVLGGHGFSVCKCEPSVSQESVLKTNLVDSYMFRGTIHLY